MKNAKFKLEIPNINGFETRYYFEQKNDTCNPKVYPPHLHDTIEAYVLLEGDVSFMVESSVYNLSAGDVVITKPNEMHNCVLNSNSVHKHGCFWFFPTSDFLFGDFTAHEFGKNNVISPDKLAKERLFALCELIKSATDKGDDHQRFYLILELLDIMRKFIPKSDKKTVLPEQLEKILSDANKNFATIQNLNYFTEKYFISQSTLYRLFKDYLRTTPKLYLETKRLAHARELLKGGKSVSVACAESGFSDYSNFIRLFKKRFNLTPNQYKNN